MSRVQHSILFPCFYEVNFYHTCQGDCMCVVKGTAEKVYRGEGLGVRIVRGIWDEEDWDVVRAWAPVTHKGSDCQALWHATAFLQIHGCQLPQELHKAYALAPGVLLQYIMGVDPKLSSLQKKMDAEKKPWRKPQVSVHAASPSLLGELAGNFRDEIWLWRLGLKHGKIFSIL